MDVSEYGEAKCRYEHPMNESLEFLADGKTDTCENDDSVTDDLDHTCSDWYDDNPTYCGKHDTLNFTASEACCVCEGATKTNFR